MSFGIVHCNRLYVCVRLKKIVGDAVFFELILPDWTCESGVRQVIVLVGKAFHEIGEVSVVSRHRLSSQGRFAVAPQAGR